VTSPISRLGEVDPEDALALLDWLRHDAASELEAVIKRDPTRDAEIIDRETTRKLYEIGFTALVLQHVWENAMRSAPVVYDTTGVIE
jgi:hypothetical protein